MITVKRIDSNPESWSETIMCPGCGGRFSLTVRDINYDGEYYGRCIDCRAKIPIRNLPDSVKRLGSHGGFEEEDNDFGHYRPAPLPVHRPLHRDPYDDDDTGGH